MKKVGGYADLMALETDGLRYDDVLIMMQGEQQAQKIAQMRDEIEAEKREGANGRG